MDRLSNWIENLNGRSILLLLFLYSLWVRFPFFFRDYIDRDESTFILMGQSWVDGYLPYTELWDIKPPLTFFFFAAIIFCFGKSFIAIRFFGVLLITISSFFTYKLTSKIASKKISLFMGLLCIVLQSLFGSLQGVMSEHLVMAVLTPSLWLISSSKLRWKNWLVIGLLIGVSVMIKLNVAYVGLFLGFYALIKKVSKNQIKLNLSNGFFYGLGILTLIFLVYLPYYLAGLSELWWKSVILAPLNYAGARQDSLIKLSAFILPVGFFLFYSIRKNILDLNQRTSLILTISTLGILVAFYRGGRINGHYLILLYPVLLPLIGAFLSTLSFSNMRKKVILIPILLFLVPVETYLEYITLGKNKIEKGSFFNGEGIEVPKYLIEKEISHETILFTGYHIGYWLLDTKPPTKAATQPSNILKDEMFFAYENPRETGIEELKHIMKTVRPSLVVTRKNRRIFDKKEKDANQFINAYLENNYKVLDSVDGAMIYKRLE
ncbi:ArnT family glycosyltransferase [Flagellimonas sp. S174]|uniref:ArnT family glycosyltransferase n=1 Tax=Flagellimonas sp. S174 TaxID=3410790 RepID=UPI003BF54EC0